MLRKSLLSVLAMLLIIEEWLWDTLSIVGRIIALSLHLEYIEALLSTASPKIALLAFCIPLLIVTPLNLFAISLLANGLILEGVAIEIIAKLVGTLLIARTFAITKAQLLTFAWFSRMYWFINKWLSWARQRVAETEIYQLSKRLKAEIKGYFTKM